MDVDVSGGGPFLDSDETISPKAGLIFDVQMQSLLRELQ